MTMLYHVTTQDNLASIAEEGLRGRSCWTSELALVDYHRQGVRPDWAVPVVLELPLEAVLGFSPEPDLPGLVEPIMRRTGASEPCAVGIGTGADEVWEAWEETSQDWKACLELIGSIRFADPIPAAVLLAHNPSLAPVRRSKPGF